MREELLNFVKKYLLRVGWFLRQYSLRLLIVVAISIGLLISFINVTSAQEKQGCSKLYELAVGMQSGVVSQCSNPSTLDNFISGIMPIIFILTIGFFLHLLVRGAKSQVIHRRPWSWFRIFIYIFYGTLLSLAILSGDLALLITTLAITFITGLIYLLLFLYYQYNREKLLKDTFRYASSTIGKDGDILGFSEAADNFRNGLLNLRLPVRVVGITGGMGEGKSSFWRIIAEGFEKEETLHTYISLTETNSTTDFSKLFAERWTKTLQQRYPFLLTTEYTEQSRLYKILRDTGNGLLTFIANVVVGFNFGIFRTRRKIGDASAEVSNNLYVDEDVAKVFSNIPELYEKQWYIVVDELERAPITEVYRLIEIIERFKQLAKKGLPVQIIFVLCYDANHFANFEKLLPDHDYPTEIAKLVKDFLTSSNRKSVEIVRRIPNPSVNQRIELLTAKIKQMLPAEAFEADDKGRLKYKLLEGLYDVEKDEFLPIERSNFFEKEHPQKEVFDYIVLKIVKLRSLRLSGRFVSEQIPFFMDSFSNKREEWLLNTNLATFMAIEYINVVRPEFLPFIEASFTRFDPELGDFFTAENDIRQSFDSNDKDNRTVREKIIDFTGVDSSVLSDEDLNRMLEELKVLVPVVGDYLTKGTDPYSNDVTQYRGTLSDPDNLKWIMAFSHGERTNFGQMSEMYQQVLNEVWPKELSDAHKIVDFSAFVRNRIGYRNKTSEASLFIAEQIYIFMLNNRRIAKPSSIDMRKNPLDNLTYEFIFQVKEAIHGYQISEETQIKGATLYDEFINSPNIKYESKLIALDGFLRTSGNGLQRVQAREEVLEKYRGKDYFVKLFDAMKSGIVEQYGKERSPVNIYNQEANIFYVLYQFWNGTVDDPFLKEMHKLASKGLTSNSDALTALWSIYDYESSWKTYDDLLNDQNPSPARMSPSRRGMYIKLADLVRFSKINQSFRRVMADNQELKNKVDYWQMVLADGRYVEQEANLTNGNDTVGAVIRAMRGHISRGEY